jgi:LDH2 family malate/lactate/ureidoglycolate dehydrogenase
MTKLVAPCFGIERMLGTNPIAIAFPSTDPAAPIVIDMATSVVAYGKVEEYRRSGKVMPPGMCITTSGTDELSPADMQGKAGSLLTVGINRKLGQHKGYCLSSMVDILCALLSGANWGPFAPPFSLRGGINADKTYKGKERPGKGIGHFFSAYKIEDFRDVSEFKSEIDDWISVFRSTDAEPGQKVLIPGDPELAMVAERTATGIPIKPAVEFLMRQISAECDIPLPKGMEVKRCADSEYVAR